MNFTLPTIIMLITAVVSTRVSATETIADDAIKCAGLFYVLTSIPDNAAAQRPAIVFGGVYQVHQGENISRSLTNGDVFSARDSAATELGVVYDDSPNDVIDRYLRCNGWLSDLGEYFNEAGLFATDQPLGEKETNKIILGIPESSAPQAIPAADRALVAQAMTTAFDSWTASGRMTRQKLKEQFMNEVEKSTGPDNR